MKKPNFWKKFWLRDLCWLFGFLVMFFIVSRAFFSFWWTDDYCTMNVMRGKTIWQYAWFAYNNWDGRGIMTGLITGPAFRYLPVVFTNSIWALALVGTAFFVNKLLVFELPFLSRNRYDTLIRTAAIAGTLWLGMGIHISETVYWATGGYYIFSAFLGVVWTYQLLRLAKDKVPRLSEKPRMLAFFFLSIPVGMLSHNLSTGLLAFGALLMIIHWLNGKYYTSKNLLTGVVALAGILIGTAIISVAPGNFIRATAGRRSFLFSIPTMIQNMLDTLEYYVGISHTLIIFCVATAFLLTFLIGKKFGLKESLTINLSKISQEIEIPLNKKALVKVLDSVKYLVAGLATSLPFALVPDFNNSRASIYFMVFLSIFIIASLITVFKLWLIAPAADTVGSSKRNPLKFAYFSLCLLFLFQMSVLISHNIQTYRIQKEVSKRERALASIKEENSDVVVAPLNIAVVPFSARFSDINEDPEFWINQCLAQYYGLKSVKVDNGNK